MALFLLRRTGILILTAICLTLAVFWLTNLAPNLEKVARDQGHSRMTETQAASWLQDHGYGQPLLARYGEWLGVTPGFVIDRPDGTVRGRCFGLAEAVPPEAPTRCGVLQGNWGYSTVFDAEVGEIVATRLALTGKLMAWVLAVMIPSALILGILSGMREGSRTDRTLSTVSILSTATPEYVSGVLLIAVLASSTTGLGWLSGTATQAMEDATFGNFALPVATIALFGMGYIARMTRASMAEVMTQQYIRTARLKGVRFRDVVLRHALRNALIAPFTVIMLQIPWLLNGVVIVETLFNYKGFGWTLVQAASNNDIELLMAVSVVSVVVVLLTQLISDVGYLYLNPRITAA